MAPGLAAPASVLAGDPNCTGRSSGATLPGSLKKNDGAGRANVQRRDAAGHRNAQHDIAGSAGEVVQAGAFAPEDQHAACRQVVLVVVDLSPLIEARAPEAGLLESAERADKVDDTRQPHMLRRTRRGLDGGSAQRRGTPLRRDHSIDARSLGAAQQRTKILRIFDAVQSQHQRLLRQSANKVLQGQRPPLANDGHDSLVSIAARHPGQLDAVGIADANSGFAESFDKRGKMAAAFPQGQNRLKMSCPRGQRFFNRMPPEQNVHGVQCIQEPTAAARYNRRMIAHLRGKLLSKQPQQVILDVGGVGYEVIISIPTFSALPREGTEVSLHIHTHVREDTLALYGFSEKEEKRIFERLITVGGVGPRLAITILSGLNAERLVTAIRAQDHATLTRIPGVGKKLSERLVVELKDKLEDLASAPVAADAGPLAGDVLSALVNLGYQRPAAQKAVADAIAKDSQNNNSFDALFRASLGSLRG